MVELPAGASSGRALIDGESHDIGFIPGRDGNAGSLLIDNRLYEIEDSGGEPRLVQVNGREFAVSVVDERAEAIRRLVGKRNRTGLAAGEIKAPMPGLVVKINVKVGEQVNKSQGLVIIEAMKMENEIKSPVDGVVKSVRVAAGQAVDKGTVLVEVKHEEK